MDAETTTQGDQLARFREIMKGFREAVVSLRAECVKLSELYPELARRFLAAGMYLGYTIDLLDGNSDGRSVAVPVAADLIRDLHMASSMRGVLCEEFISQGIRFLLRCGYVATDFESHGENKVEE